MAREFKLPDIGEGLTEAEIVRWLVAEGDRVEADQSIVEVETDKAVVEIPTPYAGVVLRHGGPEGATIAVGSVLVVIGEPDEAVAEATPEPPPPAPAPEPAPVPEPPAPQPPPPAPVPEPPAVEPSPQEAAPIVGTLNEEAESLTAPGGTPPSAERADQVKALPVVRKLARDHGIDLSIVVGTGAGGRITRQDVEALIGGSQTVAESVPARAEQPTEPVATPVPGADERRPLSRLRRTIAANMVRSWTEVPHVTTFDDVDATRLLEVRRALADRHGVKVPIEALVIKATIPALVAYPEFNATLDGDDLVVHGSHDIGIAVDTPEGLMVAVIRNAGARGVLDLASEVVRLGEGARQRSLGPDELSGQTFTISNIGAVGGGHGTPIVPPGTTGILSVGRARTKPVVYEGDIAIAPVMPLSLSYDHRVIDGAVGRRFMALILENLEEPALFLAV